MGYLPLASLISLGLQSEKHLVLQLHHDRNNQISSIELK